MFFADVKHFELSLCILSNKTDPTLCCLSMNTDLGLQCRGLQHETLSSGKQQCWCDSGYSVWFLPSPLAAGWSWPSRPKDLWPAGICGRASWSHRNLFWRSEPEQIKYHRKQSQTPKTKICSSVNWRMMIHLEAYKIKIHIQYICCTSAVNQSVFNFYLLQQHMSVCCFEGPWGCSPHVPPAEKKLSHRSLLATSLTWKTRSLASVQIFV